MRRASLDGDNLVAVATRALASRPLTAKAADAALRALLLLEPVLLVCARGRLAPYVAMLDAALAGPTFAAGDAPNRGCIRPDVVRARAHYTRGLADLLRGRVIDGIAGFERARVAARAAGSPGDEARALTKIALLFDLADQVKTTPASDSTRRGGSSKSSATTRSRGIGRSPTPARSSGAAAPPKLSATASTRS